MDPSTLLVTTSWDDGHVLDLRLADMLDRYAIPATFYIAPRSVELSERDRLRPAQIAELGGRFEVGGHTLHHPRLPAIPLAEAAGEIRTGKEELEGITGRRLQSFCYPGGRYRRAHVEQVRDAGFTMARTVRRYVTGMPTRPLEAGTTVHAYRHLKDPPPIGLRWGTRPGRCLGRFWNWDRLAIALFDETAASGGVFHLWGHSWEIDARGDWGRLERVLAHIGGRPGATYVTNGVLGALAAGTTVS
jgi:peptidoglycan/xylan/chitin deacetylase (PgdA/CDA1 family)